jgi:DNA-binding transcriptional MerR regulator
MTVTKLAHATGLSRSTVLYYESIGLLRKVRRSAANYRLYGEADADRLRQICVYRAAGLTLEDIRTILERPASGLASILERRLAQLGEEMERLRVERKPHPLPMNGILVAITVRNGTFASSGRLAI